VISRRLAALVLAAAMALPGAMAERATAGPGAESPSPAANPPAAPRPLSVAITTVTPVSVGPTDVLTISGTVTNTTDQEIGQLSLTVGVGNRVASRTALTDDLARPPGISVSLKSLTLTPQTLLPRASTSFTVPIDIHAMGLDGGAATVYPFVLHTSGSIGRNGVTNLDETVTYVPYFPGSVTAPLRVVWLWPLDAPPNTGGPTGSVDASLVTSLSSGRLRALLDLGNLATTPNADGGPYAGVTWAIEPSLVDSADRATTTAAKQWLSDLKQFTKNQNVIPLPYGDVDAVALVRAGLTSDLTTAVALGRSNLTRTLPDAAIQDVAWPVDGAVDQPTLDTYASAGLTKVLVSGDQIPPTDDAPTATESAPTTLDTRGPTLRALAVDPIAQRLLAGNGRDAATPQMARQELLALLAVAVAERPNQTPARDLVLALPRDADPNVAWIRDLLHATASLPWLKSVPLSETTNDPSGKRTKLQPYPIEAKNAELPGRTLTGAGDSIAALRGSVTTLRSTLPDDKLTRPIDGTLSLAESVFWRPDRDPASGRSLMSQAKAALDAARGGVRLAVTDEVTLASRNGKVPVTLDNSLSEDVTVRIELKATDPTRLATGSAATYTVPAGRKQRVLVTAKAQRSGTFKVTVVLSAPDGSVLEEVPLTVHSKAYGTITLAITLTALGVLVVAFGIRIRRRVRRWRDGGPGDDEPPTDGPSGDPADPSRGAQLQPTPGGRP